MTQDELREKIQNINREIEERKGEIAHVQSKIRKLEEDKKILLNSVVPTYQKCQACFRTPGRTRAFSVSTGEYIDIPCSQCEGTGKWEVPLE